MTTTTGLNLTGSGPSATGTDADRASRRRPFRDNPRLILVGIAGLLVALALLVWLAERSAELAPDYLTEVVLYALSAACLTMLLALGLLLARNILKLWVERRRALPFARFRAKLVAAMLGMTLIPSVLVLIVGSELIRDSVDRWLRAPMDDVLASANEIARNYYQDRQAAAVGHASRIASALGARDFAALDGETLRGVVTPEVEVSRIAALEVYRVVRAPTASARASTGAARGSTGSPRPELAEGRPERVEGRPELAEGSQGGPSAPPRLERLLRVTTPTMTADREGGMESVAHRAVAAGEASQVIERTAGEMEVIRAAAVVRARDGARVVGVVALADVLATDVALHSRRINSAYETRNQMRVLRRPLTGVYLSFFLMITLMILFSATWTGVYIAKRITRPVQRLAEGAREIGAGRFDHRIEPETTDEFGSLVDAFNVMAGEVATSQRKLERSRVDLERKNQEVERRRRYFETILERIATGVVSIDASGRVSTINAAAARLLALDASAIGQPGATVFDRADLTPLASVLLSARPGSSDRAAQEVALTREGREVHLAVAATALPGDGAGLEGTVMVFDDVTPLIRAQRVATWRDVARRLAHEIKNPLTPIQLCAERLRRHFVNAPPRARTLVDECTSTIVGEVEALKALVDEFSQFARMPSPRTVSANLNTLLDDTLGLYDGLFPDIAIERTFAAHLPEVRIDPEQIRRVVVNLVDNAIDALRGMLAPGTNGRKGVVIVETHHDAANRVVRLIVRDNGPGIPAADRDKLFMPYFSTKRRGSGLGLAIVRRIVVEHGGTIEVSDNEPVGTRFTIEVPC